MATGVQTWSQSPASNATADSNINWAEGMAPSQVNDSARALMASVAKWRDDNSGALVTGGTSVAFTVTTNQIEAANTAGYTLKVIFNKTNDTAATLAPDGLAATPLQIVAGTAAPSGVFQAGSIWCFTYSTTGTGQWIAHGGSAGGASLTSVTATLSSSVVLNNTANYFDGPSVAQGSTGTWLASGTVTVIDSANANFVAKLWDGTTVIASGAANNVTGGAFASIALSGTLAAPAGNIKISARDLTNTSGGIQAGASAGTTGACSVLTAIRIA